MSARPARAQGVIPDNVTPQVGGATLVNGQYVAITGQKVTFSWGSPEWTPQNVHWTATGKAFEFWNPATSQTVALSSTDPDATGNGFSLYDSTDNDTVTATLSATYTGAMYGGGVGTGTISMPCPPVTFMKPKVTAWVVNGGSAQTGLSSGTVQAGMSGGAAVLYANELWGPITITVPSLGGTTPGGQGAIAQVIQSVGNGDVRSTGSTYVDVIPKGNGGYEALPTPALDTAFPYPIGYSVNSNGVMILGTNTGTSAFNAPGTGYSGDQPKLQIFPNATDKWTSSNFSIHFGTWVMYQPSYGIWVPLQMLTWSCADTALPSAGGPIIDPVDGSTWAAPTQSFSGGTPSDTPTYPQWTGVSAGFTLGVPSP